MCAEPEPEPEPKPERKTSTSRHGSSPLWSQLLRGGDRRIRSLSSATEQLQGQPGLYDILFQKIKQTKKQDYQARTW